MFLLALVAIHAMLFAACAPAFAGPAEPTLELFKDLVDLEELEGKVVYVDFWASWCAPCLKSFPWMAELQDARAEDGFVILAVNMDRDDAAVERFLAGRNVPFQVLRDPEGKLATAFDVEAMPSAFVFGRDGEFAWKHEGFTDSGAGGVEEELDALLSEPAGEE